MQRIAPFYDLLDFPFEYGRYRKIRPLLFAGLSAEGETVVARWTARGIHQGDWEMELGIIPASGKATTTPGTSTIYLRDGKIIRGETHIDFVSLLKQMGARIEARAVESL